MVKEGFFMNPVVMMRAWSWFTCSAVVHFESVGMGEAHGWCEEEPRQTTINGSNFQIFWLYKLYFSVKVTCYVESPIWAKAMCTIPFYSFISTIYGGSLSPIWIRLSLFLWKREMHFLLFIPFPFGVYHFLALFFNEFTMENYFKMLTILKKLKSLD